jgi:hypothetical protein
MRPTLHHSTNTLSKPIRIAVYSILAAFGSRAHGLHKGVSLRDLFLSQIGISSEQASPVGRSPERLPYYDGGPCYANCISKTLRLSTISI